MPQLPPPVWADLWHDGAWNDVTEDVRVRAAPVTMTRGLSSESSTGADPTSCTCVLDSRDDRYAPRNPMSPLYGKIGRNTPFRWGYSTGSPWVEFPGTAESAVTTPGLLAAFTVGDLDLRLDVALDSWATEQDLAGRYLSTGENRSWALTISATGQLALYWSPDGTFASRITVFSTVPLWAYNGQRLAVRATLDVDNGAGGYEVRFYTGRTVDDTDWELLGDPVVGGTTTSVYDGTADIELGRVAGLSGSSMTGRLYAFRLRDGIGGTVVASMDAADAEPGDSSFTSGGRVWTTVNGTTLTNRHVRMAGEIPSWPPTRDLSGNDNVVAIAPTGVTRRMDAGNKPQDSALRRFIKGWGPGFVVERGPIECWPLTDGVDAKTAKSLVGGRDMIVDPTAGRVAPTWAGGTLTDWIEPVAQMRASTNGALLGYTPRLSYAGTRWSVDVFLTGGGGKALWNLILYDTGAGTDADNQVSIIMNIGGDPAPGQVSAIRHSDSSDSSSEAFLGNFGDINIFDDQPHHVRVSIDVGPFPGWHFYVDGVEKAYASLDVDMKALSLVRLGWGYFSTADLTDRAAGYLTYWDQDGPSASEMWDAYMGFQGEGASARIKRLAAEGGYTASTGGAPTMQQRTGIQDQAKLLQLLNEATQTDFGYLLDARDRLEVIQRGGSTLWNQPPALVLDYAAGVIAAPFRPVDDDKLTENDVSVKRQYGSVAAQHVLEDGELSVQDPPTGVGRYDNEYTYSLATDQQADSVASMRLHLGTYNGVRYTRITLNLANARVFAMIDDILRIDVGDKIRLTNLPADHGPDAVDVLVHGYEEEAGPDAWKITWNCRPGEPWTTGVADGAGSRADTGGSELAAAIDADDTLVSLAVTGERAWTTDHRDTPFDLRVGGEVMRAVAAGLVVNENPLLITDLSGWVGQSAAIDYDTSVVHTELGATASMRVTPGGASSASAAATPQSPAGSITPGASYTMCGWVYAPDGWPDMRIVTDWYNAANSYLSTSPSSAIAVPAGQWTFISLTATAPANASRSSVRARIGASPTAADLSYWWGIRLIDNASVSATSPQTFTVVRAVNGVAKTHAAGADVRLATPNYAAL
ncbi:hypothetical protein AB0E06_10355 [Streptomyces sp. NPDC048109]|uniref:hypothetical protein n=1 Tax=Streptomyces sp. NPDC048109 TaxID=3155482 RepID=UPI00342FA6F6